MGKNSEYWKKIRSRYCEKYFTPKIKGIVFTIIKGLLATFLYWVFFDEPGAGIQIKHIFIFAASEIIILILNYFWIVSFVEPANLYNELKQEIEKNIFIDLHMPLLFQVGDNYKENGLIFSNIKIINKSEKTISNCEVNVISLKDRNTSGGTLPIVSPYLSWSTLGWRNENNLVNLKKGIPQYLLLFGYEKFRSFLIGPNGHNTLLSNKTNYELRLLITCDDYPQNSFTVNFNCLENGSIEFENISRESTYLDNFKVDIHVNPFKFYAEASIKNHKFWRSVQILFKSMNAIFSKRFSIRKK